jgi:formamidopyrimidine-DNA glycosylase
MPELPEVETVRRGLEPVMAGVRIAAVEQRRHDLRFPLPANFAARLEGRKVLHVNRRGKYLIVSLDNGEALIMHLGMSGHFRVSPSPPRQGRGNAAHDHIVFRMENGARITYNDPRRFGYMDLIAESELERHPLFAKLGPEPLGNTFTPAYLAERALGRAIDLKAFLLDQHTVAGLGNIYVSEALHRAGLSPNRGARSLAMRSGKPTERAERLVPAIRAVLKEAIAAGGSTLRDHRRTDGELGYFQHSFQVYGREGEPCRRKGCTGIIRRIIQGGRATFYCSVCQR